LLYDTADQYRLLPFSLHILFTVSDYLYFILILLIGILQSNIFVLSNSTRKHL